MRGADLDGVEVAATGPTNRRRPMSNAAEAVWDHATADPGRVAIRGAAEPWTYGRLRQRAAAVAAGCAMPACTRATASCSSRRPCRSSPAPTTGFTPPARSRSLPIRCRRGVSSSTSRPTPASRSSWPGTRSPPPRPRRQQRWRPPLVPAPGARRRLERGAARRAACDRRRRERRYPVHLRDDGAPEGAQLTHGNLIACAEIFAEVLEVTPEDRMGTALPLFHVFGQTVVMGTVLRCGASLSLLARFAAEGLLGSWPRPADDDGRRPDDVERGAARARRGQRRGDFASLRLPRRRRRDAGRGHERVRAALRCGSSRLRPLETTGAATSNPRATAAAPYRKRAAPTSRAPRHRSRGRGQLGGPCCPRA